LDHFVLDGFVSETIQANGVEIRVSRAGSGSPLLLGHGAIPGARLVPPHDLGEDVGRHLQLHQLAALVHYAVRDARVVMRSS
jgi:hypothetical protein